MKKLLSMVMIGAMAFTLGACSASNDTTNVEPTETDQIIGGDPSTWGPEDDTQVISPFVEYESIHEALEHIDFDVVVPEQLDGYDEVNISIMDDTMFQIIYVNEDNSICVRKQRGSGDISGDYNVYDNEKTVEASEVQITMYGNVRKVTWENEGFAYSIYSEVEMSEGDMLQLVSQIQ